MLLLIDTSQETATVALSREGKVLFSEENKISKEHASWLHMAIRRMLTEADLTLADLKAIAVIAGPGSYTGLRVGMAAAKGFCYALNIPLITRNTLEVMAESMRSVAEKKNALICPMIDARREEVFTALYTLNAERLTPNAERLTPNAERLTPNAERLTPDAERLTPNAERLTPNAERLTPNAERLTPNAERLTPNAERLTPNAERLTPNAERLTPNAERLTPNAESLKLESVKGQRPTANDLKEILPPQAMILDKDKNSFEIPLTENTIIFFGSGAEKWKKITESPSAIFEPQPGIIQAFAILAHQDFIAGKWADTVYSEPIYLKEFFTY